MDAPAPRLLALALYLAIERLPARALIEFRPRDAAPAGVLNGESGTATPQPRRLETVANGTRWPVLPGNANASSCHEGHPMDP